MQMESADWKLNAKLIYIFIILAPPEKKGYTHIIGIEGGRIKWDSF